jgi:hypothetical protein
MKINCLFKEKCKPFARRKVSLTQPERSRK